MAPTIELIESITLSSDTATVTFTNIPQTYDDLYIVISARTNGAVVVDGGQISINNSVSNFSGRYVYGTGSNALSGTSARFIADYPGSSATANTFGNTEIYVTNYSGGNNKSISSTSITENNATSAETVALAVLWSDTSAVSSMTFNPVTGTNFVSNSTFELYGIKDADDGAEGYFGPAAQGGDEVYTTGDGYKVHVFKSSGTLNVTNPGEVEYLVVAGGGGGGYNDGGGGGAGGLLTNSFSIIPGLYPITIGAGGAGAISPNPPGSPGSFSSFGAISTVGGGAGNGRTVASGGNGGSGGSGGGGGGGSSPASIGGSGVSGQGNSGGGSNQNNRGGGGGGAGASGTSATASVFGTGGNGIFVFGSTYAGGGGGGNEANSTPVSGGSGGGGNGGIGSSTPAAQPGTVNTGGGGGGSGPYNAGAGGSGIVIIRYKI